MKRIRRIGSTLSGLSTESAESDLEALAPGFPEASAALSLLVWLHCSLVKDPANAWSTNKTGEPAYALRCTSTVSTLFYAMYSARQGPKSEKSQISQIFLALTATCRKERQTQPFSHHFPLPHL
jgi:hypothetical protein